ncbi:MAG TPA: hypothetical protein VMF60_09410, partial [Acidimicrobiales bacterium]|nr:hypothetical protein [Acidimicrobiales bacterium]
MVFPDGGSGFKEVPEDEAIDAAHGTIEADLTHLNSDSDDTGPIGPAAVEVYLPLTAGRPSRRVGVLEIYLPYAAIDMDVTSGLHELYRSLAIGLVLLYVFLSSPGPCPPGTSRRGSAPRAGPARPPSADRPPRRHRRGPVGPVIGRAVPRRPSTSATNDAMTDGTMSLLTPKELGAGGPRGPGIDRGASLHLRRPDASGRTVVRV